ncbi:MAG: hypothetical protein ACR2JB_09775 [Bryobacteraceae bacterium]
MSEPIRPFTLTGGRVPSPPGEITMAPFLSSQPTDPLRVRVCHGRAQTANAALLFAMPSTSTFSPNRSDSVHAAHSVHFGALYASLGHRLYLRPAHE